jgi:hypothetical protein
MGVVLVPVLLVLIVLVVGVVAVRRFSRDAVHESDRLQSSRRPTLRYLVPPGQDPAAVLAALLAAGYDASPDSEPGPSSPMVIIGSRTGGPPDREAVRATLAEVPGSTVNPEESLPVDASVRFTDE